ncbi:MAG TPA: hypothetical protein VES58_04590, partial [Syntrophobacteria bacterium]|nr:hypothetical protein [Syntrophobacteria bacterium]
MSKLIRLAIEITIVGVVLIMAQMASAITFNEFGVPTPDSTPYRITRGLDGNLWFTENTGSKIGRISAKGVIAEFPIP